MAKVRVYELAKDLNMTNRALLNKMKELKIEVKSHMSSLEDSAVTTIKRSLLGKDKRKTDVKIKPSVIRRRRQKVENIAVPEVEEKTQEPLEERPKQTIEPEPAKKTPDKLEIKKAPEITEPAPKKSKPKLKVKKTTPAKIIKPAVIEKPVMEPEKIESEKKSKPGTGKVQPLPPEEKEPKAKEIVVKKDEKPVEAQSEIFEKLEKKEEEVVVQEVEPPATVDKEKKTKKKKKKKSAPAKIVKIADPLVLENLRKSASGEDKKRHGIKKDVKKETAKKRPFNKKDKVSISSPGIPKKKVLELDTPPVPSETDPVKRKKEKRKPGFGDDKPAGKRRKRKRKSVIEGDALYTGGRGRKKRSKKDARGKKGNFQKTQITTPKAIKRRIKIDEAIELAELAKRMGIKANEMIAKLMTLGVMATVNQTIDFDTAALVATEFDFEVEKASFEEEALLHIEDSDDDEDKMIERAPVVTIMGHVDHGKTSLLDVIRQSKITKGEAGGITQHIGAYNVQTPNGGRVTFLDTPGHAAFTAMRSRGAQVTDIVILVVAADDGVMPQTIEAINHSKAAGVPVVVAVNKMDKAGADSERIMRELSELDLLAEEWGGNVIFVKVSAKTGQGIDELLEMVLLQSEVLELKANPDRKANGYVVESRLDTGRGAVATVLVKQGTLRDGDPVVCGRHSGRIRAMIDDSGKRIKTAVRVPQWKLLD
jgi:translation initiation factor IF-2